MSDEKVVQNTDGAKPPELPPFNPDPKRSLADLLQEIGAYLKMGPSVRWRRGVLYRIVTSEKKWEEDPARRFKSAAEFGKAEWGKSESTLGEDAAVSRAFEEPITWAYEFTNLLKFIHWANVAKLAPLPKDPGDTLLKVPGKKGAVEEKKFRDCTGKEIDAAAKLAMGKKAPKGKKDEFPPEVEERMARYRAKLKGVIPEGAPFPVKVAMVKGKPRYAVIAEDPETFDTVIKALSEAWPAVPATPTRDIDRVQGTLEEKTKALTDVLDAVTRTGILQKKDDLFDGLRDLATKVAGATASPQASSPAGSK